MYTEFMIARSEHQLMQAEIAQRSLRDGFAFDDVTSARKGLWARMRRLFPRATRADAPRQPASSRVQRTRRAA